MCEKFERSITLEVPLRIHFPFWWLPPEEDEEVEEEIVLVGGEELERMKKYVEEK